MNQQHRERVLNYVNCNSNCPLYFGKGFEAKDNIPNLECKENDLVNLVAEILILTQSFASYEIENDCFVTGSGRMRSLLDIWRHIIYYYPNVNIFDVMHAIYENVPRKLAGQFCTDICRRVFYSPINNDNSSNYLIPEIMLSYCGRSTDEFDLVWDDWKDI